MSNKLEIDQRYRVW